MSDYITFLGAEQVQFAGQYMRGAANDMEHAARSISDSVDRLIRAMSEHADRIEAAARGDL